MSPTRSGFHDPRRAGFTLVELVVVIVVLAVVVVLLFPVSVPSIHQAKANSLLQNGSQIARTFLATHITEDQRENLNPTSTSTNAFTTSTDYFKHLIKEQGIFVGTDFSVFGGAGATLAKSPDPRDSVPQTTPGASW
ncbi:MAG: prepilin-type N-terminal cleavage/methylation domain-containing protein [Kiritimatiellia bacterium]